MFKKNHPCGDFFFGYMKIDASHKPLLFNDIKERSLYCIKYL